MAYNDSRTGICPQCGEALNVPSHLETFSCLYCGARLTPAELTGSITPAVPSADAESAADYYRSHILNAITDHRKIEKSLTRNAYAPAIDSYEEACRETFIQLENACTGGTLTPEDAAEWFLDRLEEQWKADLAKQGLMSSLQRIRDTDKFQIAVFFVPMIRRLGLSSMDDFCTALHTKWMDRFPKSPWQIGDFEKINSSFRKKNFGLCYITTAVCLESGKSDHCAELTAFRSFRDGYLRSCPDGPALIDDYYRLAPQIVLAIDQCADPSAAYEAIYRKYLAPCFDELQTGQPALCKKRYTEMVRALEKEYLS